MNPTREVNDRQLLRCWSVTKICSMMKCLRPLRSMQRKERRWGRKTGFGRCSGRGLPYSMLSNSKNLPLKLSTSSSVRTKQDHRKYFFYLHEFVLLSSPTLSTKICQLRVLSKACHGILLCIILAMIDAYATYIDPKFLRNFLLCSYCNVSVLHLPDKITTRQFHGNSLV